MMKKALIYKLIGFSSWLYQVRIKFAEKEIEKNKKNLTELKAEYEDFRNDYNIFLSKK